MKQNLTCIGCPLGCSLVVEVTEGREVKVWGNTCPRGASYGEKEVTNPTRVVTTTVRLAGGELPVVPVKTQMDIPKGKIRECILALKEIELMAPVHIGDLVLADVAGTNIPVVITKDVAAVK